MKQSISVTYFNRNSEEGISIQKVFHIIQRQLVGKINFVNIDAKLPGAKFFQVLSNMMRAYVNRNMIGINHITGANHYLSYVLPKSRTITTVHDLGMLDNKNVNSIKRFVYKLLFIVPLHRNRIIVCISEATKVAVMKYICFDENRIKVIPDPISQDYHFTHHCFNEEKPVVLHLGTKPNKNLERTIKALSGINVHLRIIGMLSDVDKEQLKKSMVDYSNAYNLSEQELLGEYVKCDIVNFPSLYEGFGMPIIEAQAIGRICVTSCIMPMKMVAGTGAYLVDPYDEMSIRKAYLDIIGNEELRNNIIQSGIENAKNYTSEKVAESYLELYEEIFES